MRHNSTFRYSAIDLPLDRIANVKPFDLRDDQLEAAEKIRHSLRTGHKRPLMMAATGYGKTVVEADIVKCALHKDKRVIITVPALSLISQTVDKLMAHGIHAYEIGIIQANTPQSPDSPVQVCSIQTLWSRSESKMPKADLVLIDEAHILFKFYSKWMSWESWKAVPFVGVTATPGTRGLGKIYDDLIIAGTTKELIGKGLLCQFEAYAPEVKPNLTKVQVVAGDYNEKQLSAEMSKTSLVADCVTTWLAKGENRPTLVFAVDRAHARLLQEKFIKAGVSTGYIDGETPRDERDVIGKRLESRETQVVVNIGCLTMGVDWPFVSCIVLARPTKSEMLYVQIIGRGLRTHPGKDKCLILDHSDTSVRLGLVDEIEFVELDDGNPKKASKREREKPLPKECGMCGLIKPAGVRKCPHCGFEPKPQCKVQHVDGELVQISGKRPQYDTATKQAWYGQLLRICDEKGWNPGRAFHLYREKFGVGPSNSIRKVWQPPTPEVRNFVRACDIQYARRCEAEGRASI
jgi:DNA repair protein RadD